MKKWATMGVSVLLVGGYLYAQKVDQGRPGNQGSWDANIAAKTGGKTTQLNLPLALPDAGCVPIPYTMTWGYVDGGLDVYTANPLIGRRSIEIYNAGPNPLACRIGSGTAGRPIAATTGVWAADVSDIVPVCCFGTGAAQADGGSTWFTEIN